MQKKYGKYYADWLDATGHRRRKSFPTKKRALRHQAKMRAESTAKKAPASARLRKSHTHGPRPSAAKPLTPSPKTSSASMAQ
jgi:hypothetical protein